MGWTSLHRDAGISNREFFAGVLNSELQIVADGARRAPRHSGYTSVYYAAVRRPDGETFAIVALMSWTPRSRWNFTYKLMDETVGPVESSAPRAVLAALTPTSSDYASQWRAACQARLDAAAARPKVKPGDQVAFAAPLRFTNGYEASTFTFEQRNTFRTGAGFRVRISGWREMDYRLAPAEEVAA